MKSLYHPEYLSLNEAGNNVDQMTRNAVREIFEFWLGEGYSPREISQVMQACINDFELHAVLMNGVEKAKENRCVRRATNNKVNEDKK